MQRRPALSGIFMVQCVSMAIHQILPSCCTSQSRLTPVCLFATIVTVPTLSALGGPSKPPTAINEKMDRVFVDVHQW